MEYYTHFGLNCNMFLPIPSLGALESVLVGYQLNLNKYKLIELISINRMPIF